MASRFILSKRRNQATSDKKECVCAVAWKNLFLGIPMNAEKKYNRKLLIISLSFYSLS